MSSKATHDRQMSIVAVLRTTTTDYLEVLRIALKRNRRLKLSMMRLSAESFWLSKEGKAMSCFNTIRAWKVKYSDGNTEIKFKRPKNIEIQEELKLPCGKCIGCQLDHANNWATRCWCESKCWNNNCFVTLTYDNEHLPRNGLLNKKDVQDFLKRLRYYHKGIEPWQNPKTGKTEYPIRYLVCGEYGPSENSTHRPHYHIIFFNWKPNDLKFYKENFQQDRIMQSKELRRIWGNGFITVEDFNYKTACYVARYTTKKLFKDVNREVQKKCNLQPEFIESSRNGGIGIKYWNEHKNEILKSEGILIKIGDKVKNRQIPKYFERKYKEEIGDKRFEIYQEKKIKKAKESMEQILKNTSLSESEYKRMIERQLKEKAKILKRNNFI